MSIPIITSPPATSHHFAQLIDDYLDFTSDESSMGKPVCADLHLGGLDRWMEGWMEERMERWMEEWMKRWMDDADDVDGWMDGAAGGMNGVDSVGGWMVSSVNECSTERTNFH